MLVDHVEEHESVAIGGGIELKVHGPYLVRGLSTVAAASSASVRRVLRWGSPSLLGQFDDAAGLGAGFPQGDQLLGGSEFAHDLLR